MTDIQIQSDWTLAVAGGDWVAGLSDAQHQALLMITAQGEWKEYPDAGVGASRYAEAENPDALLREVRQQYTADGLVIKTLTYNETTGKLTTDANYGTA